MRGFAVMSRSTFSSVLLTFLLIFRKKQAFSPECCGEETFRLVFSGREIILGQESGYARDAGADTFYEVHPGEHLEDERISGAEAVTEVCSNIGPAIRNTYANDQYDGPYDSNTFTGTIPIFS